MSGKYDVHPMTKHYNEWKDSNMKLNIDKWKKFTADTGYVLNMKELVIEMFELIDAQEAKTYPDENGNDVYWNPTKLEGNDELMVEVDKMRSGDYTKETISSFLNIMKENEDVCISSVRIMAIERLGTIFLELEKYVE